jgi:hypothetical protein
MNSTVLNSTLDKIPIQRLNTKEKRAQTSAGLIMNKTPSAVYYIIIIKACINVNV